MNQPKLYLGVDGGGTKTVCIAINQNGKRLGRGESGSSNRNSVGDQAARQNLESAINLALDDAASAAKSVTRICLGMSGVGRPDDRALVANWIEELLPTVPSIIHNDAVAALASGTHGTLYGIVLISGTGMIAYGFDADGNEERVGGWGPLLGEKGSGYAIGAAALSAVTAAVDGTGPQTTLQAALLNKLALQSPQNLVQWTYAEDGWHHIAALAPLVFQQARLGDSIANTIVQKAAAHLAEAATVLIEKLSYQTANFPIVLAGGLMNQQLLYRPLTSRLATAAPQANIGKPKMEPAEGAAHLARNMDEKM